MPLDRTQVIGMEEKQCDSSPLRVFAFVRGPICLHSSCRRCELPGKLRSLLQRCDEAALVHWTQADAELPSWEEAHKRIQQEGRQSKVNHPSVGHTAHTIPAPTAGQ